jgi:AraC family transcriptional regulator of arabinose operon
LPEIGRGLFVARLSAPQVRERARRAFLRLHADARAADALHGASAAVPAVPGSAPDGAFVEPPGALQHELALNGLEEVLLLAVREDAPAGRRPLDPRVERVLELVSHDLAAPHTVGTLAAAVGLSPSRLAHLFKHELGDSVTNTVLTLRLRQAARLLEYTSRRVGAIAGDVGFSSAFYFSRQFHRHFGLSPRAYRARMARD